MALPGSTRRLALASCSRRYLVRLAAVQPFRRSSSLGSTRGPLTPPPLRGIGAVCLLGEGAAAGSAVALALDVSCRSEEHTSELQSLMRISYAVFCLKKKKKTKTIILTSHVVSQNKDKTHNTYTNEKYTTIKTA